MPATTIDQRAITDLAARIQRDSAPLVAVFKNHLAQDQNWVKATGTERPLDEAQLDNFAAFTAAAKTLDYKGRGDLTNFVTNRDGGLNRIVAGWLAVNGSKLFQAFNIAATAAPDATVRLTPSALAELQANAAATRSNGTAAAPAPVASDDESADGDEPSVEGEAMTPGRGFILVNPQSRAVATPNAPQTTATHDIVDAEYTEIPQTQRALAMSEASPDTASATRSLVVGGSAAQSHDAASSPTRAPLALAAPAQRLTPYDAIGPQRPVSDWLAAKSLELQAEAAPVTDASAEDDYTLPPETAANNEARASGYVPTDWSQESYIFRALPGETRDPTSIRDGESSGFEPFNPATLSLLGVWYGGYERDPKFLAALDALAKDADVTVQQILNGEFLAKQEQMKQAAAKEAEEKAAAEGKQVDPAKRYIAPTATVEEQVNELLADLYIKNATMLNPGHRNDAPLQGIRLRQRYRVGEEGSFMHDLTGLTAPIYGKAVDIVQRFRGDTLHDAENDERTLQQRRGAKVSAQDTKGNIYTDNGTKVVVRLMPQRDGTGKLTDPEKFKVDHASNVATLFYAGRHQTVPATPENPAHVKFQVNTSRFSMSRLAGNNTELHRERDLMVIMAMHEGRRLNIVPSIHAAYGFGGVKPQHHITEKMLSRAAVNELRMKGIKVDDLLNWYNQNNNLRADADMAQSRMSISVSGSDDDNTQRPFRMPIPEAPSMVPAPANAGEAADGSGLASLSTSQIMEQALHGRSLEDYAAKAAHMQTWLMVMDSRLADGKNPVTDKAVRSDKLEAALENPAKLDKARELGMADPITRDQFQSKLEIVNARQGLGGEHEAVPPLTGIIEKLMIKDGESPDNARDYKFTAVYVQALARLSTMVQDKDKAHGFPAMKAVPQENAQFAGMANLVHAFNELKTQQDAGNVHSGTVLAAVKEFNEVAPTVRRVMVKHGMSSDFVAKFDQMISTLEQAYPEQKRSADTATRGPDLKDAVNSSIILRAAAAKQSSGPSQSAPVTTVDAAAADRLKQRRLGQPAPRTLS